MKSIIIELAIIWIAANIITIGGYWYTTLWGVLLIVNGSMVAFVTLIVLWLELALKEYDRREKDESYRH